MSKKIFSIIGMVAGLLVVLCGVLSVCGILGGETYSTNSAPAGFDSGFATFGGDYYTYSVNNTAEIASATRVTSSNLREISDFLKTACGLFMIGFGLVVFCGFGIVFASCPKPIKEMPVIEEPIVDENGEVNNEEVDAAEEIAVVEEAENAPSEVADETAVEAETE